MKALFLLLTLSVLIFADTKNQMYHLYQDKQYKEACTIGMRDYASNRNDEEYVSLYAFSCLNADYIDRLAIPISSLKYSDEARSNAAYFSIILMQKKLLYHALVDNYPIGGLKLPSTDYILSKVFDLYSKDSHEFKRSYYTYNDSENPKASYKLYITEKGKIKKMVIEEYYDTMMINRHIYW